jgi:hypothetical protein
MYLSEHFMTILRSNHLHPKNTFLNSSSKNSDLNQICLNLKLKRYLVKDYF